MSMSFDIALSDVHPGTLLRERARVRTYRVEAVVSAYWGDGATGYRLAASGVSMRGSLPFWVRPEELLSIYTRA